MSFIYDHQTYSIVGDNFALSHAPPPDNANSEQVNYLTNSISIYLSGLNNHVTTMSSAGNTVIHERGDYTTFTDLGGSLTIYGFAAHDIIDLRTDFGITGANALTYVQPDGHGGTLIGGGSNALRGASGAVASIDLVGVAPSQLTAAQFA
jgi:hypothetical protein